MSLPLLKRGVNEYLRRGVPASKLVLAMPWWERPFLFASLPAAFDP